MLTRENFLEGTDRFLEWNELALETSENLGNLERLRHETLDLTSTLDLKPECELVDNLEERFAAYSELIFLGQLIHTQNSNDILERLVILKDLLDSGGDVVMLPTDLLEQ
jgi:hypothetical protein